MYLSPRPLIATRQLKAGKQMVKRFGTMLVLVLCAGLLQPVPSVAAQTVRQHRLGGVDRFATAVAISRWQFPSQADEVYLARADVFADAVAGGSLQGGPILLVPREGDLPAGIAEEIDRLSPQRVIALGGPAAITDQVLAQAASGSEQARLAGAGRGETAIAISAYRFPDGADSVYLARADVFADAVAGGSLPDGPTLLVPSTGAVPPAVLEEIARLEPARVVALGGVSAVSEQILQEAARGRTGLRLGGATRYETAVAISQHVFGESAAVAHLARGDVLADAVAAGSLTQGPILLVPSCGALPEAVADEIERLEPEQVVAIGGVAAVCDDILVAASRSAELAAGADGDADGVPDRFERAFGSDPANGDSDADGLTDAFEALRAAPWHLPASSDTDGNKVRDPDEDVDEDGLVALAEQAAGTDPLLPDTDGDGLLDGPEVNEHGTDPLLPDTDGDGLDDGAELAAGTDPQATDSDGDGVADGAQPLTFTAEGPGARVALTGTGDLAGGVQITSLADQQRYANAPGQVGTAVDVSLDEALHPQMQGAEIALAYDPALVQGDEADLRLFRFDEERGVWVPAAERQVVDQEAHEVRAAVDHFSVYAVFDVGNWGASWTALGPCLPRTGTGEDVAVDVAFVLDSSNSMQTNDPQGLRRDAAKEFVDALLPEDRGAVAKFYGSAELLQPLTAEKAALRAAIDAVDSSGFGTSVPAGVNEGLDELARAGGGGRAQLMIVLTDGQDNVPTPADPLVERAGRQGVTIYTVGLGAAPDAGFLSDLAEGTGGSYYGVAAADQLPDVLREIDQVTGDDGTDTDGDGLTDCEETQGANDRSTGTQLTSDPRLADTDGDGLDDGEEIGPWVYPGALFLDLLGVDQATRDLLRSRNILADPRLVDSDADGLADPDEADSGSNARIADSEFDGLRDGDEKDAGTEPRQADTDGDTFGDNYEHLHRGDGFDPLVPDARVSRWRWANDYLAGLVFGDFSERDSIAWLLGSISGGVSSVVPAVGWVTGTAADIRDTLANLLQGDVVGTALSGVGLVPYAGDAAAVTGRVLRFATKHVDKADEVAVAVARQGDLPEPVRTEALRLLYGEGSARRLIDGGVGDATLLRLQGGRTNLDHLADAIRGSRAAPVGVIPGFFNDWRAAEDFVRSQTGGTTFYFKAAETGRGRRFADSCVGCDLVGAGTALEVKNGFVRNSARIIEQIEKDFALLASGRLAEVQWHFFPSGVSDSVGADPAVLARLDGAGRTDGLRIPYRIYLPEP